MKALILTLCAAALLLSACSDDGADEASNTADSADTPAADFGPPLEVGTVSQTDELAWSADVTSGMAAVAGDVVVYYTENDDSDLVLVGSEPGTGEVLWELGGTGEDIGGTEISWWLPPNPSTVEVVNVDGVPAVLARGLDRDLGDASSECDELDSQHALVAIEASSGTVLWVGHPDPPSPENSCAPIFHHHLITTDSVAVLNGSGGAPDAPLMSVAIALDSGEVLWKQRSIEMTRSTRNAIIGVRNIAGTDQARCGLDHEFLYTGFDPVSGDSLWELDPCEDPGVVGLFGEQLLIEVGEGVAAELRALDARTGETLATYPSGTLPNICASDGSRMIACYIPTAEGDEEPALMLVYDSETAEFDTIEIVPENDQRLPYLIWEGQIAFYMEPTDTTLLYDPVTGEQTAEFPGWLGETVGSLRLSSPPPDIADYFDSTLNVYSTN
ncbi:outer membrane protein assembly factor BamB family protein [Glycomyces salinus]|uniref:outer membrane protein assembly factor BamB family protein n=1 Tax=Glycomyces salinus TaxID=980294 RepID=UPI0018EC08A7|nr:PQQ-binding-like beta-propeller repeat protein [Glycomyces salinus]